MTYIHKITVSRSSRKLKPSVRLSLFTIILVVSLFLPGTNQATASPEDQRGITNLRVNSQTDTVDINPGDGICADAQTMCTLRAAIMEANTSPEGSKIELPAGIYSMTIPGSDEDNAATGDLDILQSMAIQVSGRGSAVIRAESDLSDSIDRVFHVIGSDSSAQLEVSLEGLTIENGRAPAGLPFPKNSGGGLLVEGYASLELTNTSFLNNSAPDSLGQGGGILFCGGDCKDEQAGEISILDSQVNQNSAAASGGGIALLNLEAFEIQNTSIMDNSSSAGGGGASIRGIEEKSTIQNSTLARNQAQSGGGLEIEAGLIHLINTTVSGNITKGNGAGINTLEAKILIFHTTITANKSSSSGGGIFAQDAEVEMGNSILAGNLAKSEPDCSGEGDFDSAGYNLIQNPDGCTSDFDEDGDITGEDPLLAPLADNGGSTFTHALDFDSPAAHYIAVGENGCGTSIRSDQRGKKRPGSYFPPRQCEIGAWEAQREDWAGKPTRTFTVTVTETEEIPPTPTHSPTATESEYPTETATETLTPSVTFTETEVPPETATATKTATETGTATLTPTITETEIPAQTATGSTTPTATLTTTGTTTPTAVVAASLTASPTKTRRPHRPTRTPTATLTTTNTTTPTAVVAASLTASPTKTLRPHRATRTPTVTSTVKKTSPPTITTTYTLTQEPTRTLTPTRKPTRTKTRQPQVTLGSTLTSSPTAIPYYPPHTLTPGPQFPTITLSVTPRTPGYFTAIVRTPAPTISPSTPSEAPPPATQVPPQSLIRRLFGQPWILLLVAIMSGFLALVVLGLIIWLLFFDKRED